MTHLLRSLHLSALLLFVHLVGTAQPHASGRLTDQPDLDQQIAEAEKIAIEIVGPATRDLFIRQVDHVRNTKTGAYNFLVWYDIGYHTPTQVVCIDTANEEAKRYTIDYIKNKRQAAETPNHINMIPDCRFGRYTFKDKIIYPAKAQNWKTSKDGVIVYDAPTNRLYKAAEIGSKTFFSTLATSYCADRGTIRVLGRTYDRGSGFRYYEFDPRTEKITVAEPFHTKVPHYNEYTTPKTRSLGDWSVSGIGPNPFILVAHNYRTGEWKKLLQLETTDIYTMKVDALKDGRFYITTRNPKPQAWFVEDGVLTETPPLDRWKLKKLSLPGRGMFDPEFDSYPKITIENKWAFKPNQDDLATISWLDEKGGRHQLEIEVRGHVFPYKMIAGCGDVLYGKATDYFQGNFYNVKNGKSRQTGVYGSVYYAKSLGNILYEAAYPDFKTRALDLSDQSLETKPADTRYGQLKAQNSHRPIGGIELGSDGNIYLSGEYSRTRRGGGLAWFNPETKENGGLKLEPWRPFWMASVQKGRYMIMSCTDNGGTLVVYDIETKKLTDHRLPGDMLPGYICSIDGDHIVGWGIREKKGVIYRYDPIARKIVWQKSIGLTPETGKRQNERRQLSILFDGTKNVYMNGGDILLRIQINTGHVDVLGKIPAHPIAMIDGEIYSAGYAGFARLKLPR